MQMRHARFLRIGRHSGGCARKCSLPISAIAASSACWLDGSSVMANGSASRECPGNCSTASTLIAYVASTCEIAARIPGRSRTR